LVHLQIDLGVGLHAFEDVEPAAAAVALDLVRAVGNALQLLKHEARHIKLGIENARITNIGNSPVDDDTRVEHERAWPLNLFGELDIGNNESKLFFRLNQHRNANV